MDLLPITLRGTLNLPKPIRPKPAIKPEQFRPIPRRVRTSELVWIGLDSIQWMRHQGPGRVRTGLAMYYKLGTGLTVVGVSSC